MGRLHLACPYCHKVSQRLSQHLDKEVVGRPCKEAIQREGKTIKAVVADAKLKAEELTKNQRVPEARLVPYHNHDEGKKTAIHDCLQHLGIIVIPEIPAQRGRRAPARRPDAPPERRVRRARRQRPEPPAPAPDQATPERRPQEPALQQDIAPAVQARGPRHMYFESSSEGSAPATPQRQTRRHRAATNSPAILAQMRREML